MSDRFLHAPATLMLRVVLGAVMIYHGWQKFQGPGLDGIGAQFQTMGIPAASIAGPFTLLLELVGGVLMVLGVATRLVGLAFAATMAGAIAFVHGENGFSLQNEGYEYALTVGAIALFFALCGAGALSIDGLIRSAMGKGKTAPARDVEVVHDRQQPEFARD